MTRTPISSPAICALGNVAVELMRVADALAQACADYENDRGEDWWAADEPARRARLLAAIAAVETINDGLPAAIAKLKSVRPYLAPVPVGGGRMQRMERPGRSGPADCASVLRDILAPAPTSSTDVLRGGGDAA